MTRTNHSDANYGYGKAILAVWDAPTAVGYTLVGGILAFATLYTLYAAFPPFARVFGYDMLDVAVGARLRNVPVLLLTFAYAAGMLVVTSCVWMPFKAAATYVIGRRHREPAGKSEPPSTFATVVGAWRLLLTWSLIRAFSSGFVAKLFPPIARVVRDRFVTRERHLEWRSTVAFLTPVIVLETPPDLETAVERSHRRANAAGTIPRPFLSVVALSCVLALVTMTGFLAASVSLENTVLGYLAACSAVGSIVFGIIGAATLETAVRTRQYVDLDDVVFDGDHGLSERVSVGPPRVD